jgi:hypothetical protein
MSIAAAGPLLAGCNGYGDQTVAVDYRPIANPVRVENAQNVQ